MEFLAPWALVGLVLVPAIFLWGLWAPRGRPVTVGSLMLWRRVLAAGPAGKPSARVRLRDPLLWLDAAAVLLVVLACARPAMKTVAPAEPVATLVIDRAAHMWIGTNGPFVPRYNGAAAMVSEVLNAVGGVPLRVVFVPGAEGAVAAEEMRSRDFLDPLGDNCVPVMAARDVWPPAVAEAARRPDVPVVVVTGTAPLKALPPNVFVLAPGGQSANVGITHAAARIQGNRCWLLVGARADAGAPGPCRLIVGGDARTFVNKPGFLAPGASAETTVAVDGPLPRTLTFELMGPQKEIGPPDDCFMWDNFGSLSLEPEARTRVLLVGTPDPALRRALAACEATEIIEAAPGEKVLPGEVDVVIAYAAPVPAAWIGPAAVIAPPEAVGPVRPTARLASAASGDGQNTVKPEWQVASGHPLAEALYLEPPRLAAVPRYAVDPSAQLLLGTPEAPLMVTWEESGARRLAVLFGFDENTTDWTRRAGFPVFWSHALDWLVPADRRPAEYKYYLPFEPLPGGGLAPATIGYGTNKRGRTTSVCFIGTDEGFQSGPGRDDSKAAVEAIGQSIEAKRRAALSDLWPWLAAAALVALLARAWVAR